MLRESIAEDLVAAHREGGFQFPDNDRSFAAIPHTVAGLHGVDTGPALPGDTFDGVDTDVRHVVVVLIDGFGLRGWRRDAADHPLLTALESEGTVTPLSAVYPSETAAALTTLHTGRPPVEHGLLGWDQYLDGVGLVETLPFRTKAGTDARELDPPGDPRDLFEGEPIYDALEAGGVATHAHCPAEILTPDNAYSGVAMGEAERHPYDTVAGAALELRRTVEAAEGPTYHYLYLPHVDAAAHRAGTESGEYRAQLAMLTECVRRELVDRLAPEVARETLLVATADHGHVDTAPERAVDLSEHPEVWDRLRRAPDGDVVPPTGGPRNCHLHLQDGAVPAVREYLHDHFDVRTFSREAAVDRDLFGHGEPSETFRRRCGDLVAVHRDQSLYHPGGSTHYVGMHGGLHPHEMLVPFAAARVDALQE